MKKLLSILCLLILTNCNQNNELLIDSTESENLVSSKISQIQSLENISEQRVAYTLLNENEKFNLWQTKLDFVLRNNNDLTVEQKEIIKTIKEQLKITFFENKSDDAEYFKNIFIPTKLKLLKSKMSTNEIGAIFYSVSYKKSNHSNINNRIVKECDCNRNSMFSCLWLNTSSCVAKTCKKGLGSGLGSSCGFFWAFECNGRCNA